MAATQHQQLQHLQWPFFDARHRELAASLDTWCATHLDQAHGCLLYTSPSPRD